MAKKKPLRDVQSENAELLDNAMNTVLKEGVTAQDPVTGAIVKLTPSAAMFNAIRGRIKDLGVQSPLKQGTAAGNLVETARQKGMSFKGRAIPPVNTQDPDAATA